ncbi:MAG: hypothetical protein KIT39_19920 [Nitrospirales bacterium]|nr:hypothetical protein [Nitrospirales bacterium]
MLRTLTGQQQEVDPEAVAPFEVSHDEAKEWVKSELGGVLGELKGGLAGALKNWAKKPEGVKAPSSSENKTEPPDNRKDSSTAPSQPGLALFAALTGESMEALSSDSEVLKRGLNKLSRQLGSLLTGFISSNGTQLENAQSELRTLFSTLREHGIPVSNRAEEIPLKVRKQIQSAISDEQKELGAARLETLAQWLEETAAAAASSLRKTAAQWREGQTDVAPAEQQENQNSPPSSSS